MKLLQIMFSLRSKVFLCNGVPYSKVQINISIQKDIICIGYTSIQPIPVILPWLLIQVLFICSGIIIKSLIFFQNLIRKCLVSSLLARQYLAVRYNMFISFQVSIRRSVWGGGYYIVNKQYLDETGFKRITPFSDHLNKLLCMFRLEQVIFNV